MLLKMHPHLRKEAGLSSYDGDDNDNFGMFSSLLFIVVSNMDESKITYFGEIVSRTATS